MTELTQDELTVLLVAREGEPMMPIGRWEEPVRSLLARGYLRSHRHEGDPTGYFNNYITPAGKTAADKAEDDSLRAVIKASNDVSHTGAKTKALAESIARDLVRLAEISSKVTGDPPVTALERWSRTVLSRALELLK